MKTLKPNEIFNASNPEVPFMKESKDFFKVGELYDIPHANPTSLKLKFEFVGIVGNGTKLQFRAAPGDWTVTLAPVQAMNMKESKL